MLSIDKYWVLIGKLERFANGWRETPPFELCCEPGCDDCCKTHLTIFAVEAAAISGALRLREGGPVHLSATDNGTCPFLAEGRCAVYELRPILCRTQGFPLFYQDEQGEPVAEICLKNRGKEEEISLPADYALNLDILNRCLSSLNFLYLAEMEERGVIVSARVDITTILDFPPDMAGASSLKAGRG